MDVGAPYRVIENGTDLEVLRVIAGTTTALTGRTVARLVRTGSHPTVLKSLTRLADLGILDVEQAGRAYLYRLNADHLAVPHLVALATLRDAMLREIGDALRSLRPRPQAAGLFGSAARGDGDAHSDLDILIISDTAEDTWDLSALADRLRRRTGNHASLHVISPGDLAARAADGAPIMDALHTDYIRLLGPSFAAVLAGATHSD